MSEEDDEKAEQEQRRRVNLVSAIAVLLLIVGGYWLLNYLQEKAKIEACIEFGPARLPHQVRSRRPLRRVERAGPRDPMCAHVARFRRLCSLWRQPRRAVRGTTLGQ